MHVVAEKVASTTWRENQRPRRVGALGIARMRSHEAANITSPARSIEVDERKVNRG
jgi:hypothetical protein